MNWKQAKEKGFDFTGIFSWDKEEVKNRAKQIRGKGYKCYLVSEPPDPLSRGHHGTGYSVYAEPKYELDKQAEDIKLRISRHQAILDNLKTQYDENVAKENAENQRRLDWLKEKGYIS